MEVERDFSPIRGEIPEFISAEEIVRPRLRLEKTQRVHQVKGICLFIYTRNVCHHHREPKRRNSGPHVE